MYGSYRQHVSDYPGGFYIGHLWKSITIRTATDPVSLVNPLQKVVAGIDKDQAVFRIQTMEQGLTESLSSGRFLMRLFGIFAGLALFLAAVGIYGVMSYLVSQRTHELGIRLALGAGTASVLQLVIGRGLKTTALGLCLGILGSLALTRLVARMLYEVKPTDPLTYLIVALVLSVVALAACYIPARRATKVDPLLALRHD
jgi:putative ABC transport system permease protein